MSALDCSLQSPAMRFR